ncbi:FAD-dependent monooxygenase [Piscinibacter sp. Jin2]|uniref:FAD-dependent monooxygenase n=1 Tax=Aquariibacter lacus TaxID=2801332 RepID=A0A9X0XB48_9BURK|nr:FAD-dependent monooxygenase [Piscinibacter lacus]MBL0718857.1 FAD-dependent monooxygenase [Piscinibacter lacus]
MPLAAPLSLALVGAGPVGLSLALQLAAALPQAAITVFDARAPGADPGRDPRTLALSLGSVQVLEALGLGAAMAAQGTPIRCVHVSQQTPTLGPGLLPRPLAALLLPEGEPVVRIAAEELGLPALGTVMRHGALVAPLQDLWEAACAREPQRLALRLGTPVAAVRERAGGVELDCGIVETHDLAVIAEGGVFAEQARKALRHDYGQTAWVGTVTLARPLDGMAVERFTASGPAALLPLPPGTAGGATPSADDGQPRAALVWCVPSADDPVAPLDAAGRLALLNTLFPDAVGPLTGLSPLKSFALGLNAERSLVRGRQVRIGNAAQTLHPVAGQGLNLGLRDAQALVAALVAAEEQAHRQGGPLDLDAALRRIEWQRAPDRWSLIAATDLLARGFTWPGPALSTLRGLGLAAVGQLAPLRRALARQMMFGWR